METNKQQAFAKLKSGCESAVTKMDYHDIALALCEDKEHQSGNHCMSQSPVFKDESVRKQFQQYDLPAQDRAFCQTKKTEFCNNLQTEAGFLKAAKLESVST